MRRALASPWGLRTRAGLELIGLRRGILLGVAVVTALVVLSASGLASTVAVSPSNESASGEAGTGDDELVGGQQSSVASDPVERWARLRLAEMTTADKIRSLLIGHVSGVNPDGMRVAVAPVSSGGAGWGGVILMRDNVVASAEEMSTVTELATAEPELPPVVSIDEEGGEVIRLPFDPFAGADDLRTQPVGATTEAFAGRGALLASVGISVNFGIVADITADPGSFIYRRTLGDGPTDSAERVGAAVTAEQTSVASTLKHFPGHGRTAGDSHVGIPEANVSRDEWRATDAVPFAAGVDAGATFVMFGHLAFPAVDAAPASLSATWHDVLRRDLGFDGISVTDDMLMLQASGDPRLADPYANAVAALAAGNDALLYVFPADPATVGIDVTTLVATLVAAVDSGVIPQARVDESALKLLTFRRSLAPGAEKWHAPCDLGCVVLTEPRGTVPDTIALAGP